MHPLVVLEGLSGVGKSTVAQILTRELGARLVKTPMTPFAEVRGTLDEGFKTVEGRYLFYLSTVVEASRVIRDILPHSAVVVDRYILTTECYHRALGLGLEIDLSSLDLALPDLTILLTCEERERLRRVDDRGWSFNDENEEQLGVSERFLAEYRQHQVVEVSTTERSPKEIVEEVIRHLQEVGV